MALSRYDSMYYMVMALYGYGPYIVMALYDMQSVLVSRPRTTPTLRSSHTLPTGPIHI